MGFQNAAECSKRRANKRVFISDSDESEEEEFSNKRLVKVNNNGKSKLKEIKEMGKRRRRRLIIDYDSDDFPGEIYSKGIMINEPSETQFYRATSKGRVSLNTQGAKKKLGEIEYKFKGKAKITEEFEKKLKRKASYESDYNKLKSQKKFCNGTSINETYGSKVKGASSKGKQISITHLVSKRQDKPEESNNARVLKSKTKGNERATRAIQAMEALGFNKNLIVNVLKQLYKLYLNKWELIEDDNYRALADAILDALENETINPTTKEISATANQELETPVNSHGASSSERPRGEQISSTSSQRKKLCTGKTVLVKEKKEDILMNSSIEEEEEEEDYEEPLINKRSERRKRQKQLAFLAL